LKKHIFYKLYRVYCLVKHFRNEVTPKAYVRKLNPIQKKANWSSILDFHGVIYFLQKNTRLYTDVFLELQVSRFSFHYFATF
jgi:hypothetical protein